MFFLILNRKTHYLKQSFAVDLGWAFAPSSLFLLFSPLPPLLKFDVTNSWICTFLHQNQHAPHNRLVQIWSERIQNPPAAWWWIGILGTMLMHQASALWQMTVNCFSDKSLVWDSTDYRWMKPAGFPGVQGNLVKESRCPLTTQVPTSFRLHG